MIKVKDSKIQEMVESALRGAKLENKGMISCYDISNAFGISVPTVHNLVKEGKLIPITFSDAANSKQMFLKEDIVRYYVSTTIKNRVKKGID